MTLATLLRAWQSLQYLGEERDKQSELFYEQGKSIPDLALKFNRTPEFIFQKLRQILGSAALEKQNRRGQWSTYEIRYAENMRKQGLPLFEAGYLAATDPSKRKE